MTTAPVRSVLAIPEIFSITLHQLLGRRRTILLVLLSAVPVLLAAVYRAVGESDPEQFSRSVYNGVFLTILLPIVAVLFGTAAFGAEIEDGTIVYLLAKPVARWRIVLAKVLAAGGFTIVLSIVSVVVTGAIALLPAGDTGTSAIEAFVLASVVGSLCYVVVFAALSLFTRRALVIGIAYLLVWEGGLANLLPGVANLSIRQYALGVAGSAYDRLDPRLGVETALIMTVIVVVGGLVIATWRLSRFELPGGASD